MLKPKLRIFSNLARTGGTLVSRCIASMDGVALLSEIHPNGSQQGVNFNILAQAKKWYQLFQNEPLTNKRYSFCEITEIIAQTVEKKGLHLVIRDWAHLDFMAVPFFEKPYYHSRLVEVLEKNFNIIQYHLVRHPVPQWFSTDEIGIIHGKLPLEQYLEGYYRYAQLCVNNGYVRYEDFTHDPEKYVEIICMHLQLNYDPGFMKKWSEYTNITGDNHGENNRSKYDYIKPTELPVVDGFLYEQLHSSEYYTKSLELLGYDDVMVK